MASRFARQIYREYEQAAQRVINQNLNRQIQSLRTLNSQFTSADRQALQNAEEQGQDLPEDLQRKIDRVAQNFHTAQCSPQEVPRFLEDRWMCRPRSTEPMDDDRILDTDTNPSLVRELRVDGIEGYACSEYIYETPDNSDQEANRENQQMSYDIKSCTSFNFVEGTIAGDTPTASTSSDTYPDEDVHTYVDDFDLSTSEEAFINSAVEHFCNQP